VFCFVPIFHLTLQASTDIQHIVVTMKVGVAPHERRHKPNQPTKAVTKSLDKSDILLRAIVELIKNSQSLETITFDNVKLSNDMLSSLGSALSNAVHDQPKSIKALSLINCPIGSSGLRILTPHINKLIALNTLTLDNVGLTDDAMIYLTSIIRAAESHMDQLYWNSTLRMDSGGELGSPGGSDVDDLSHVYYSGLVMLDLSRNAFSAECIARLAQILKSNHWLLGLNLRGNNIDATGLDALSKALEENTALEIILLGNNPGFSRALTSRLRSSLKREPSRLDADLMPEALFERFSKWNTAQTDEIEGRFANKEIVESVKNEVRQQQLDAAGTSTRDAKEGARQQQTPVRVPGVTNWNEGADDGISTPFDYVGNNGDSLEFAIPTPKSGGEGVFQELNSSHSPVASPALSLLSKASGDFPHDGRPPSRNSLRPRSAQSFDVKAAPLSPVPKPVRSSLPSKWPGMRERRPQSAGAGSGLANTSLNVSSSTSVSGAHVPFYPSGAPTSSIYTEIRASNALELRRSLFRGDIGSVPNSRSSSRPSSAGQSRRKLVRRKKKGRKARSSTEETPAQMGNRLDDLTCAVEMVSDQLRQTTEKLMDVSESLSETALNLSLTPMAQAAAQSMLGLSQMDTSLGSMGEGSAQSTPVRSHRSLPSSAKNTGGSPSSASALRNGSAGSSPSKSPHPQQDFERKNEELKAMIRDSVQSKLTSFLANS